MPCLILKKKLYLLAVLILMLWVIGFAQPNPEIDWDRQYFGEYSDYLTSIVPSTDHGYLLAGYGAFGVYRNIHLIKVDSSGDQQWAQYLQISPENFDEIYDVSQAIDGGYILAGYSVPGNGDNSHNFSILKVNDSGSIVWAHNYGGNDEDIAYSIAKTSDSGYVLCGTTRSFGFGEINVALCKINSVGDSLWFQNYGGITSDATYDVEATFDGGFILAGITYSFGVGLADYYLIKTDSNGDTIWTRTYGGSGVDAAYAVKQTSDHGYICVGVSSSFEGTQTYYVVKTNEVGDTLWTKNYMYGQNLQGYNTAYFVEQMPDGGYMIGGQASTIGGSGGYEYFYLVRTDSVGNKLWDRYYEGFECRTGLRTLDGGFILGGWRPVDQFTRDFYVVKTGTEQPVARIEIAPDSLDFGEVAVGDSITMYFTITSTGLGNLIIPHITFPRWFHGNFALAETLATNEQLTISVSFVPEYVRIYQGFVTIQSNGLGNPHIVQLNGIGTGTSATDAENLLPASFSLSSYPNPFNPSTTLSFDLDKESFVKLVVFDITGREVKVLVNERKNAGEYHVQFDGSELSSGIYLARMELNSGQIRGSASARTIKMVLLK